MFLDKTESMASIAMLGGKPIFGFSESAAIHDFTVTGGDQTISIPLGSDFTQGGFNLAGLGVGANKIKKDEKVYAFVGKSTLDYGLPNIFASNQHGGAWLSAFGYERSLGHHLVFNSLEVLSAKFTSLESLSWQPRADLKVAATEGIGNNSPYVSGLFNLQKRRASVRVSYARSGKDFTLVSIPNMTTISNNGLNVQGTFLPLSWLSIAGGHTQYLTPKISGVSQGGHSTLNSAGATARFKHFDSNVDVYRGTSISQAVGGKDIAAGTTLFGSHLVARASWYKADQYGAIEQSSLTFQTPRFSVTSYLTRSGGKTNLNFGGSLTNNRMVISVGYSEQFTPGVVGRNPFQSVLTISVSAHVRDYSGAVQTVSSPKQPTLWTAYGGGFLYGPLNGGGSSRRGAGLGGKYVLAGIVTTEDGSPVQGAAIAITNKKGKGNVVWSDSQGHWEARVRKIEEYAIAVSPDDFTAPETYIVRECPAVAKSGAEGQGETIHVVLLKQ